MTPSPELRKLIDRLLSEDGLGRVETSRLEELLKDPASLRYYSEVMAQESMLGEALSTFPVPAPAPARSLWKPIALAAAACVVFGLGFLAGRPRHHAPLSSASPASPVQITGVMGVEWERHGTPTLSQGTPTADRVAFRSGLVELTYTNGVRVTLEGPADFSIDNPTSGTLNHGKLVAFVPPGAEGFAVDYAKGRVVDLGTEFALDVSSDGKAELGVFDGEVELHLPGRDPFSLLRSEAVFHDSTSLPFLKPIPFDREKFVRRMPSRDFRWALTSSKPEEIEFDVTHLIWKASDYRAVFKWISGVDAIVINHVELRRDGIPVALDDHRGTTGDLHYVDRNVFRLNVPQERFAKGRWTLHASVRPYPRSGETALYSGPVESQGILQFEEGLVTRATEKDFIGRWSYRYFGNSFVREFHPDGRITLERNGETIPSSFPDSRWIVEDGILKVWIPERNAFEFHVLRDPRTLIFTTNPYDNATRITER